ncbi:hypothetical protein JCM8547_003585 [Rhodosporidiobolus lusitaniae]
MMAKGKKKSSKGSKAQNRFEALPTSLPGSFEGPPTPPDSPSESPPSSFSRLPPQLRPEAAQFRPPAASDKHEQAIQQALEQRSLGFVEQAYETLALAGGKGSADLLQQQAKEKSKAAASLAGHVFLVQASLEKGEWTKALAAVGEAEKEWKEMGREVPFEGVKWKLAGFEGAKKWDEMHMTAADFLPRRPSQMHFNGYYLALACYHFGDLEEAIAAGTASKKAKKGSEEEMKDLGMPLAQARDMLSAKQAGKQAFVDGKFEQAAKHYSKALGVDPQNQKMRGLLLGNRVLAYLKAGQLVPSISDCDVLLALSPKSFKTYLTRAKCFLAQDNVDRALRDLSQGAQMGAGRKEYEAKHTDHYKILGVERSASADDIRKKFRALAREHHPDKCGDEEEFKKIRAAYEVLGDEDKRAGYDRGEEVRFQLRPDDMYGGGIPFAFFFSDILFSSMYGSRASGSGGGGSAGGSGRGRGGRGRGRASGRGR